MKTRTDCCWAVPHPFLVARTVLSADCDRFGHSNNAAYLGWLEELAWAHSESVGLGYDAYERIGCGCVARRHELDYLLPTFAGDELLLGTWIAENTGRLSMWRGYQIIRSRDKRTVLRARTHWVCVDLVSGRPRRQPPEFVAAYRPGWIALSQTSTGGAPG